MNLVSFDAFRSMGIPGVKYLKPETMYDNRELVQNADWILFPEYWQVNTLVYAWKKKIFPSISSYHIGHNKVEMTRAVEAICPSVLPYTRILANTESSIETVFEEFSFPFVAKEIKNSMGRGVFLINGKKDFLEYASLNDTLYIQEYLPVTKDVRVVIIGGKAILSYWREAREGCFHNNVAKGGSISFADIPPVAVETAEKLASMLGVDHAGFDLALLDDSVYFFEFNTKFGNEALNMKNINQGDIIFKYLTEYRNKSC